MWLVEAPVIPPTLIISNSSVISSSNDENSNKPNEESKVDTTEAVITIFFEADTIFYVSSFKENKKVYEHQLVIADFTPAAVFRDNSVPDLMGYNSATSQFENYSHISGNSWEKTTFNTTIAAPPSVSAFAINGTENLFAASGSGGTGLVVAKVNRVTADVLEFNMGLTNDLHAVDAIVGNGDNFDILASFSPNIAFQVRQDLSNNFDAIKGNTNYDPEWTHPSTSERLTGLPFLRPMTSNKIVLTAHWDTSKSTAVVIGKIDGTASETFDLGDQKLDAMNVLGVNAKDDIVVGRLAEDGSTFIEFLEVLKKLDNENQFTSLGTSIIGTTGANNCNLSSYRVGIDNLGKVYAVYVTGGVSKKIVYKTYENSIWSNEIELYAQVGDTCPTVKDFHISATPSRGGIR